MSQNLVIIYATVRHDKQVLLYRSLVLRNEPEGEQIRGLLATHADKSGPLVVQALVRLLASHADEASPLELVHVLEKISQSVFRFRPLLADVDSASASVLVISPGAFFQNKKNKLT